MSYMRPNYFLAFQVYNTNIHNNIRSLQEKIIETEPSLFSAVTKVALSHITLAVGRLDTDEDVQLVSDKLDEWRKDNIERYQQPINIKFTGVDVFNTGVVYVKTENDDNCKGVYKLAKEMFDILDMFGFAKHDEFAYNPHLTLLKLTKDAKFRGQKKNYQTVLESFKNDEYFGTQLVSSIQLLSMTAAKDKNGYYFCSKEVKLFDYDLGDHTDCCSPLLTPSLNHSKLLKQLREDNRKRFLSTLTASVAGNDLATEEEGSDKQLQLRPDYHSR